MHLHDKQQQTYGGQSILGVDFHRFMQIEDNFNYMEIAKDLGVSLAEVKTLKKKLTRT